jgi:hypothetical protein
MLRLEFNGNLMNAFEQSLASGQPISPGGDWTEEKIFAAAGVLYRAALKALIAKDLPGQRLDCVDQNARQRAQRRFMRALVEILPPEYIDQPWPERIVTSRI